MPGKLAMTMRAVLRNVITRRCSVCRSAIGPAYSSMLLHNMIRQ